jgi:elongation factor G
MTDLQSRRALIMGMDSEGKNQVIKAKVPLAEMSKYVTSLSSITSGRGTFSMTYDNYQQVPGDVQDKLLKEYEESLEEED